MGSIFIILKNFSALNGKKKSQMENHALRFGVVFCAWLILSSIVRFYQQTPQIIASNINCLEVNVTLTPNETYTIKVDELAMFWVEATKQEAMRDQTRENSLYVGLVMFVVWLVYEITYWIDGEKKPDSYSKPEEKKQVDSNCWACKHPYPDSHLDGLWKLYEKKKLSEELLV